LLLLLLLRSLLTTPSCIVAIGRRALRSARRAGYAIVRGVDVKVDAQKAEEAVGEILPQNAGSVLDVSGGLKGLNRSVGCQSASDVASSAEGKSAGALLVELEEGSTECLLGGADALQRRC